MKICLAQTKPITGDITSNVAQHKRIIAQASDHGAALVIFPELSLTSYEPALAKELATDQHDPRLDDFQTLSDTHQITIGVGLPTQTEAGICISMVLFQPQQLRRTYSKKYIHADEEPFFVRGQNFPTLTVNQTEVGLAICYELSIPEHAAQAAHSGAEIYIASVAKFTNGVEKASQRLAEIARQYGIPVLMSNCVGPADGAECAGQSAVWDAQGMSLGQLGDTEEGIIIFDTDTQELITQTFGDNP